MRFHLHVIGAIVLAASGASADSNDWVNPSYVLRSSNNAGTANARTTIVQYADSTAKQGPWTVSHSGSIRAPNNDLRDYLSWAPYHWPDCNWCPAKGGRTHLATGSNDTAPDSDGSTSNGDDPSDSSDMDDPDDNNDGGFDDSDADDSYDDPSGNRNAGASPGIAPFAVPPAFHQRRMAKRFRRALNGNTITLATLGPSITPGPTSSPTSQSSDRVIHGTPAPAQDPAKTQKKVQPTPTSGASCTPSPTTSMPPSATWTTCPYKTRDGELNPDVRQLHGINAINGVTQSVLYNALAYAFTKTASYSQSAASFIDAFFLDAHAGVHPELSYGQVIRGPGNQQGQYLGILDFRGMVKIANAIQVLRASGSPDWNTARDGEMGDWVNQYLTWLQTSSLGKKGAAAPNNHGTFYHNQLAALRILLGDANGASAALNDYFQHQFLDQIAASGEQPFEAVRTRPFHYRCFNLEAMITNAKLGDQVGLNLWVAKSKYGATIQKALDYTMGLKPGEEDVSDIFPHVAAVAAAYGDPSGKYAAFLKRTAAGYTSSPFYFYDQAAALSHAPASASGGNTKRAPGAGAIATPNGGTHEDSLQKDSVDPVANSAAPGDVAEPTIPFECPAVFALSATGKVQLDDGVYVTCAELKKYYGYIDDAMASQ